MPIDLRDYSAFVEAITSDASNNTSAFVARLLWLDRNTDLNPALLNTAGTGLCSESGEFNDIVKKILFHGKEVTPDLLEKMKAELGDVAWYWINACRALGVDPYDVVAGNISKLESRHPDGKFNTEFEKQRDNQGK